MDKVKPIESKVSDAYLDNPEKFLEKFFNKPESEKSTELNNLLRKSDIPWEIRQNIFPQRHMLLNWYPFEKNTNLLEVGAEYGALTGLFLEKLSKVTCFELSPSKATVIKKRFKNYKNLIVDSGNISKFTTKQKFDYVTLIGVLEHPAKYSKAPSPYTELLKLARGFLKPKGHLLLAIDNKIGLKYISGTPEDHTGLGYSSLENYPQNSDVKTFTRKELLNLLELSGYTKVDFYYPFPDYKFPKIVFSEPGLKSIKNLTKSTVIQTQNISSGFESLFNETYFGYLLVKKNLLNKFSNSFLIDAQLKQ